MTSDAIDYDAIADEPVPVSDDELKSIADLAGRQIVLEDWIANQELRLKEAKKNLKDIAEEKLPEAMKTAKVKHFELENGFEINLSTDLRASITKANMGWCFGWLEENGHGDLIKNEFKTTFGSGEADNAQALELFLLETEQDFDHRQYVHHSTLPAFCKRELDVHEHGEDWEKRFGIFRQSKTKIVRPKG